MSRWIGEAAADGRIVERGDGPHGGNAGRAAGALADTVSDASAFATDLARLLSKAHSKTRDLQLATGATADEAGDE
jgi:hypothetical protein